MLKLVLMVNFQVEVEVNERADPVSPTGFYLRLMSQSILMLKLVDVLTTLCCHPPICCLKAMKSASLLFRYGYMGTAEVSPYEATTFAANTRTHSSDQCGSYKQ